MNAGSSNPLLILRPAVAYFETPRVLADTIRWCRSLDIREVWMIPHRGHAEPIHMLSAQLRERCKLVRRAARAFRAAGISPHVNLFTIGMNLSPPHVPALRWQSQVDHDGRVCAEVICPLDAKCRRYLEILVGEFAATGVDAVWIDDDFKYKTGSSYCFCPLHIAAFNKLHGHNHDRLSLVKALQSDGFHPTQTAKQWNDFQLDLLLEWARCVERAVHRVNPDVRLGSMAVRTNKYYYGSDFSAKILAALAGPYPPMTRPDLGQYGDYVCLHWDLNTADNACASFPANTRRHIEIETWPYTRFRSGARPVQLQIAESLLHGYDGAALNLHEYNDPADRDDDDFYARALNQSLPLFRSLRKLVTDKTCVATGIRFWSEDNHLRYRSEMGGGGFDTSSPRPLGRLGLPLAVDSPQVHVLTGNSPAVLESQGRLEEVFAQGVMIDVDAARWLIEMGRTDLIGHVRLAPPRTTPVIERLLPGNINGKWAGRVISLEPIARDRLTLQAFVLRKSDGYSPLSHWEDQNGRVIAPAVFLRETSRGRVAFVPYSFKIFRDDPMITNWKRQQPFRRLFEWLGGQSLSAYVEGAPDAFVHCRATPTKNRIIVGITNRSYDTADGAMLSVTVAPGNYRVQFLDDLGRRKPVPRSHVSRTGPQIQIVLRDTFAIEAFSLCVFALEKA